MCVVVYTNNKKEDNFESLFVCLMVFNATFNNISATTPKARTEVQNINSVIYHVSKINTINHADLPVWINQVHRSTRSL